VEAYRWQIDPVLEGPPPPIQPRALVTAKVDVTSVVDLRTATARMTLDLTSDVLRSDAGERESVHGRLADRNRRCLRVRVRLGWITDGGLGRSADQGDGDPRVAP
jgi:hypothetical protein